jgi:hypothetical protein
MIDDQDEPIRLNPTEMDCTVNLKELISLHGYFPPNIRQIAFQTDLYQELALVHSQPNSFSQWKKWCQGGLQSLPDTGKYPSLKGFREKLDAICGGKANPDSLAKHLGYRHLYQCKNWLEGKWLEEYTLRSIAENAQKCQMNDYSIDLNLRNSRSRGFQIDLAAVKGYQLFAISCMASKDMDDCKEHLFEVYIRARQIGGDEARIGLICCYPDRVALQQEIEENWFTEGRVRIFGMNDLLKLPTRLKEWFETANDSKTK